MSPDDQALLDYARMWAPYGGPRRGDILVEFGMSPAHFYTHLRRILDSRFLGRTSSPRVNSSASTPWSTPNPGRPDHLDGIARTRDRHVTHAQLVELSGATGV